MLSGVALSSLFSAGTILIQYFAQDFQIAAVVFWTSATWAGPLARSHNLASVTTASFIYFLLRRWDYNALDSGEETAKSLG